MFLNVNSFLDQNPLNNCKLCKIQQKTNKQKTNTKTIKILKKTEFLNKNKKIIVVCALIFRYKKKMEKDNKKKTRDKKKHRRDCN